ncbi:MAG: ABC transporter substrate-binding protein [Asgard group archaeon]|nr:ABC transporter substrate-binding protein [Asgard group archaeon]
MIKKNYRRMILPLAVLACLTIMPFLATPSTAANPEPFFNISILAPNTNPNRNQWATIMVEQLPKIGIGIDTFDHTGWAQISPRTWDYPGPYPIPTYEEGGYDILFVGWSWGLDWDPSGMFDKDGWIPNGDNHYQYYSQEMDNAIGNYTQSFVTADRIEWAEEIQRILYRDVPASTIIYPLSLYPMAEDLTGMDGLLWASSYQPMENWEMGTETEFHYATPADFVDFHPHHYASVYDAQWLRQIYNGMIERQNGTRLWGPRIATSYDTDDGQTFTVTLDSNAKWADEVTLNASDIKYNYELLINPDYGSPDFGYYSKYIDENTVTIVNEFELTMEFVTPYVFQESNLAVDLIPKHIWEGVPPENHKSQAATWATSDPSKLIGAGPYKLEEYDPTGGTIHLTKNLYFADMAAGTDPNFEDVYFEFYSNKEGALSALSTGHIDMVDAQFAPDIDEVEGISGTYYRLVEDPGTQEMGYNCQHPYLGTGELCPIPGPESGRHIRTAIDHMIPRETIVDQILNGLGTPGVTPMPAVAIGFDEDLEPREYSIELAKEQMRAAGFEYPEDTAAGGIGLVALLGVLGLAGACQVIFLKRRK